ncbi:unnamed protein product [Litomosoides sigmodontis]|uniref:Uncharacterized protein n=1 Tax=Litomosoides sigmodontis TaxID=42156 RepID=A0A3P6S1K3_LITSI|nr:unnamed protein product [Litomosoides sigmodontis]
MHDVTDCASLFFAPESRYCSELRGSILTECSVRGTRDGVTPATTRNTIYSSDRVVSTDLLKVPEMLQASMLYGFGSHAAGVMKLESNLEVRHVRIARDSGVHQGHHWFSDM